MEEKLKKLETAFQALIKETKAKADTGLNEVKNKLYKRLEEQAKAMEALEARVTTLEEDNKIKTIHITRLEEEVNMERDKRFALEANHLLIKKEVTSIKEEKEEGEIHVDHEAIKEAITKEVTKNLEVQMEATKEGWVEVVRKNIRKEVKEEAHKEEHHIVHSTIEEEKMRQARRLNIRVSGIRESGGSTPEEDGKALCAKLGYKIEDPLPFTKAWRAGKDATRARALILQFPSDSARATFMKKKVILRGLHEEPIIYLDDDLTKMQIEHRRACMPRVLQARKEGKRAMYRDGRIIIDGKAID